MLSLSQLKYIRECEDEEVFIETLDDLDIERRDWERSIYKQCDIEDMEE
jgi:hypothetical protein